jgi:hypothetical protein
MRDTAAETNGRAETAKKQNNEGENLPTNPGVVRPNN